MRSQPLPQLLGVCPGPPSVPRAWRPLAEGAFPERAPAPLLPGHRRGVAGRRPVLPHGTPGSTARPARTGLTVRRSVPRARRQAGHQLREEPFRLIRLALRLHVRHRLHCECSSRAGRGGGGALPGSSRGPRCAGQLSLSLSTCEVGTVMPPGGWLRGPGKDAPWPPVELSAQRGPRSLLLCSASRWAEETAGALSACGAWGPSHGVPGPGAPVLGERRGPPALRGCLSDGPCLWWLPLLQARIPLGPRAVRQQGEGRDEAPDQPLPPPSCPQVYMNAVWHGWAIPMFLFLAILRLSLNYLIARWVSGFVCTWLGCPPSHTHRVMHT